MMRITDSPPSNFDQIGLEANQGEFYVPPITHFIATVEDLTDMLDYASEETDDMDEDVNATTYAAPSLATPTTGRWTAIDMSPTYL